MDTNKQQSNPTVGSSLFAVKNSCAFVFIRGLAEADFSHAILEVIRAGHDLDFDTHEKDRQIAPVNLGKTHRVLLRRDDHLRLPLFAAVDGVQDLLLRKTMVIGKALGINQFTAAADEVMLKTFRLRDAAERSDLAALDEAEVRALAREHVFEIKRVMHAFYDARAGIKFRDALAKLGGFAVAFGDKNRAG